MKHIFTECSDTLNSIFVSDYYKDYNSLRYKNKKNLLAHMSAAYRRWYYSSFVEGTIITPSVVFQKLSEQNGSFIAPVIKYPKHPESKDITFVNYSYSLDNHPVVDDLKIFLEACVPYIDLKDDNTLSERTENTLIKLVSMQDTFYLDFLLNISIRLKLLKKMPSLYSNKAQATGKIGAFFEKGKRVVFDKIFNATIEIAQINISEIMPPHANIFKKEYFLELLKKPIPTDFIFKSVYSSMGLNVESFFNDMEEPDNFDMFDDPDMFGGLGNIMLSSTYLLGVLLDRYFLTPFGHYLKIIAPFYFMPYQFREDLQLIHDEMKNDGDLNSALWGPPSSYFLTQMGLAYFKIEATSENFLEIPDEVPVNELIGALKANSLSDTKLKIVPGEASGKPIYEIKAKISSNKKLWFNIEIESDSTLHQLHEELCDILFLDYENDYSIYLDESESPFMQYISPFSKKRMKKADLATLESLEIIENQKFMYVMPHGISPFLLQPEVNKRDGRSPRDITMRIDLEVLKIKNSNPRAFYPLTTKKSKALSELECEFNDDFPF